MTEAQSMMLAICCGISIGWVVGELVGLLMIGISRWRKKRREKKANKSE